MNRKILSLLFFLVGALSVLPYVLAYTHVPGTTDEKLHYFYQDSELVYLARIREIIEGHPTVSSPVFYEYKNVPNLQQSYGEWVYALATFGHVHLLPTVALLSKFVFPGILAVLVFLCVQKFLRMATVVHTRTHTYFAFFLSILVTLGLEFNHAGFWRQLFVHDDPLLYLSLWTRIVNPITGALGFFFVSYVIFALYEKQRALQTICAGVVFGLMSGYFFSFTLTGLMLGGILLCAVLQREWSYARSIMYVICIAFIINIFYIYHIVFGVSDIATLQKSGLLVTHDVLHNKILYLVGAVLVVTFLYSYYVDRTKNILTNRAWQWAFVCTLAGIVLLNQQVITGKTIWPGHFVQYTNPVSYIIFFISLYKIGQLLFGKYTTYQYLYERVVRWCAVLGTGMIVTVNLVGIYHATLPQSVYADEQRYASGLMWLSKEAPDPCVVFVYEKREQLEKYVPAYTHCDLYHSAYVFMAIPPDRIMHNYITYLRMRGVSKEDIATYLDTPEAGIYRFFFEDWVDLFPDNNDTWLLNTKPIEVQRAFIERYKVAVEEAYTASFKYSLDELLRMYQINYIMYDSKYELPSPEVGVYEEVFRSENIIILKVP